jgi:type I restriction enzyme, S subunit
VKDWRCITLAELISAGDAAYQTGPFGTVLKASEYAKEGVPLISVGEIREGYLQVHSTTPRIAQTTIDRLPNYILKECDIVFGRKGAIDRNAIINKHQDGWFLGSDGIRLRLFGEHNSTFFSYLLRTPNIRRWLMQNGQGAIMPGLNQKILDRLPLTFPCPKTQQKIAAVLSALDAKIELNHRINAELEAMAKLLYDYWFVQFDFPISATQAAALGKPSLEGKPYKSSGGKMIYNPQLKREIPVGWECELASKLCDLNLLTWTKSDYPYTIKYVDLANTKNGSINDITDLLGSEAPSRAQRILKDGDTIIGTVRPENRSFALVPKGDAVLTASTGFAVLTPKKPIFREYNYLTLTSELNILRLSTIASGAAYPAVNPDVVCELKLPIPREEILRAFHYLVAPLFDHRESNNQQNQHLTTLRDWLLPMLMNGQVRVKEN